MEETHPRASAKRRIESLRTHSIARTTLRRIAPPPDVTTQFRDMTDNPPYRTTDPFTSSQQQQVENRALIPAHRIQRYR